MWGGRAFAGSDDPQIVWMQRVAAARLDRARPGRRNMAAAALPPEQARVAGAGAGARRLRPPLASFGIWMLGPVLLEYANEAQKREHLPQDRPGRDPLVPGLFRAGRRLRPRRACRPRCEDKGDHWLINGQKIWTSYANKADWCFCLVRTDPTAKKHEGISFVLIDMATPGVETRPIKLISGESPVLRDLLHRREDPQGEPGRAS